MHYRFKENTSIKASILVHLDIEVWLGLTKAQCVKFGLGPEDEGHTLSVRGSIAATRVVRNLDELRAAVENAEQILGRDPEARFDGLEQVAAELWPDGS